MGQIANSSGAQDKELRKKIGDFFETIEQGDLVRIKLNALYWLMRTDFGYELGRKSQKGDDEGIWHTFIGPEGGIRRVGSVTGYFCVDPPASRLDRTTGFRGLLDFPENYISLSPYDLQSGLEHLAVTRVPLSSISEYANLRKIFEDNPIESPRKVLRSSIWPDADASRKLTGKINWIGPID